MNPYQDIMECLQSRPEPGEQVLTCPVCNIPFETNQHHKSDKCIVCTKKSKTAQPGYRRAEQREYNRKNPSKIPVKWQKYKVKIKALRDLGLSIVAIAERLSMSWYQVKKLVTEINKAK